MAVKSTAVINQGKPGKPGSTWFNSVGVPLNTTGIKDDFCIDGSTGNVYKKGASTWSLIGNIQGPQGIQGPSGSAGASDIVREVVILTSTHITNKSVTLSQVPSDAGGVQFFPDGGPKQRHGVDYTVVSSNVVSWASLGLENLLEVNDSIEFVYTV